jgi:hypothetical protein
MSLDPRLIRYSIVKMGTKFEEIKDILGKAEFNGSQCSDITSCREIDRKFSLQAFQRQKKRDFIQTKHSLVHP